MKKQLVAILGFALYSASSFGWAECKPPTSAKSAEIVSYVMKKYQISSSANLILSKNSAANEACFWKLDFVASGPTRNIVLYLSPDGKYLTPLLFDLSADPMAEMRSKNRETMTTILAGSNPPQGTPDAPVTIVEFSDFECPFCRRMTDVLEKEVLPKEKGKVNVVFRNFPLPMHPWAKDAAELAECAALQDPAAFWSIHDFLFQNQSELRADNLHTKVFAFVAEDKQINQPQFHTCVDRELSMGPVNQDQQLGAQMGIHGTPTVFINGVRFDGLHTSEEMIAAVESAAKGELLSAPERATPSTSKAAAGQFVARSANQCNPATTARRTGDVQ